MNEQLKKVRDVIKNKLKTDKEYSDLHMVNLRPISYMSVMIEHDQEWGPTIQYNEKKYPYILVGENWSGFNNE